MCKAPSLITTFVNGVIRGGEFMPASAQFTSPATDKGPRSGVNSPAATTAAVPPDSPSAASTPLAGTSLEGGTVGGREGVVVRGGDGEENRTRSTDEGAPSHPTHFQNSHL